MRRFVDHAVLLLVTLRSASAQTSGGALSRWIKPYLAPKVAPVNMQNSQRIFDLMRAGQLYLSLDDAIALALENNLDIELERFLPKISNTDLLRARGGGLLRGSYEKYHRASRAISIGSIPTAQPISNKIAAARSAFSSVPVTAPRGPCS